MNPATLRARLLLRRVLDRTRLVPGIVCPGDYQSRLEAESRKWGEHLAVEAAGTWNAWLDHPLILEHYRQRGLIDGEPWERYVVRRLGGPAARSLELGCGSGSRSHALFAAGVSACVEGMDVSTERVAEAERRRQQAGLPGRFWVEDVNAATLPPEQYDLIFSCHSFHHFLKLEQIMAQVREALTPRGLFVLEEFVGPTQFQWTDRQLEIVAALLGLLPERLRTFRWGRRKDREARPSVAEVVAASPFESIRSAEILPLFRQYFEIVEERRLGGTIQHLLYNGIAHNFDPNDPEARRCIEAVCSVEDALIDSGLLPSDFTLIVGTVSRHPPGR